MRQRPVRIALLVAAALLLAGLAGAIVVVLPYLPIQQRWARERWRRNQPAHYELQVRWNEPAGRLRDLRAEVRDGRIVAVTDLTTGAALDPRQLGDDLDMLAVERLFDSIARASRPAASWRSQIARYHPLLARWLDRCVERLPEVRYDAEYGYPALISYHSDPCQDLYGFRSDMRVSVERFRPLP